MARVRLPVKKKILKTSSADSDSMIGSSKTVKSVKSPTIYPIIRKRCSVELPESAMPGSKIVPWEIYCFIREALDLRKHFETKKNDEEYLMDLESAEGCIKSLAEDYKVLEELPPDWQYDPATAKDFTAVKPSIATRKDKCSFKGRDHCCAPLKKPLRLYPKTDDVPLTKDEKKIWKEFREFDKDIPGLGSISLHDYEKERIPVYVDNPIVRLIGCFAINAFNELIYKHVKPGKADNLYSYEFMECSYIKMNKTNYYFHMTVEAMEDGEFGVYETKVKLKWADGRKSLNKFVLTDRTPRGTRQDTQWKSSTPYHPVNNWKDPMGDKFTGMRPRSKRVNCVGYDYHTPWG
ncbi:hypothetical protein Tco_0169239 [Tanacetum coccineum]